MTVLFGDKKRFAAEVDDLVSGQPQLRRVDLWAAGHWLTCDDNTAYLPQFCGDVRRTINWLKSDCNLTLPDVGSSAAETHTRLLELDDGSREQFWFPRWGPTTDNIVGHVFRAGDRLFITFEFWRAAHPVPAERGVVFVAELPQAEFVGVLEDMLRALGSDGDA